MSTERWRIIPKYPEYRISDRGRVLGKYGLCIKPYCRNPRAPEQAAYSLTPCGGKPRLIRVSTLMREAWRVDFVPTWAWVLEMRRDASNLNASRKLAAESGDIAPEHLQRAAEAPVRTETVVCSECPTRFERPIGSNRTTCCHACSVAKGRREVMERAIREQRGNETDAFYALQTLCPEFPSWDCPQMDPFTNRMEPAVWIDVPVVAAPRSRRAA